MSYCGSGYVSARKDYTCADCGELIGRGSRHLYWRTKFLNVERICYRCSVRVDTHGVPVYFCRDIERRQQRESRAQALREKYPKPKDP